MAECDKLDALADSGTLLNLSEPHRCDTGESCYYGLAMKALLLNTILGICMGRFLPLIYMLLFIPIVAAEVTYSVLMHDLSFSAGTRRFLTQLAAGEFAFLLGILLRPRTGRAWE